MLGARELLALLLLLALLAAGAWAVACRRGPAPEQPALAAAENPRGDPVPAPALSEPVGRDPVGDGSGAGVIGGGPPPVLDAPAPWPCDCAWVPSNVVAPPHQVPAGGRDHGLCYVSRDGRALFGDLDSARNVCRVNVGGAAEDAAVFRYLAGTGCETPLVRRFVCDSKQGDIRLDNGEAGVCLVEKQFTDGTTDAAFGYVTARGGLLRCMTATGAGEDVCSGFKYLPIEGAYCMPPRVVP
jgi:hypothetical protein